MLGYSRGRKEGTLFCVTVVGAVERTPLRAPSMGWPGVQSRDLLQGKWALSKRVRFQPAGPVVHVQSKQEETTVGQAGPLSLFGKGIRPSGFVGLSAAKVGGGCRPPQGHGETQFRGMHGSWVPAFRGTIKMASLGKF